MSRGHGIHSELSPRDNIERDILISEQYIHGGKYGFHRTSSTTHTTSPHYPLNIMSNIPSGLHLLALLSTHLNEIIDRESGNYNRIYLYPTGNYWTAFEKSAYQLERLFPQCSVSSMVLATRPAPIVLASLPYADIAGYDAGVPHITIKSSGNDEQLATMPAPTLPSAIYRHWHVEKTEALEGVEV